MDRNGTKQMERRMGVRDSEPERGRDEADKGRGDAEPGAQNQGTRRGKREMRNREIQRKKVIQKAREMGREGQKEPFKGKEHQGERQKWAGEDRFPGKRCPTCNLPPHTMHRCVKFKKLKNPANCLAYSKLPVPWCHFTILIYQTKECCLPE